MDMIEHLTSINEKIKGIWCVPKYSNPTGITYSDEVVRRFAKLKPAAKDFRIFWDNAYVVHDLTNKPDNLLNIFDECRKYGSENLPIAFFSTSKITFAGSGVAAIACTGENFCALKKRYSCKTIGYDKINQIRHIRFLKNTSILKYHMKKHGQILRPKFELVINAFRQNFGTNPIIKWTEPKGGYFINVETLCGCAKKIIGYCGNAGLKLTEAGSTYPHGIDPDDTNIRIAPSYPEISELENALQVFCVSAKLACAEKILSGE
jgi:DNA-binding transcriptional MocR family regulator